MPHAADGCPRRPPWAAVDRLELRLARGFVRRRVVEPGCTRVFTTRRGHSRRQDLSPPPPRATICRAIPFGPERPPRAFGRVRDREHAVAPLGRVWHGP